MKLILCSEINTNSSETELEQGKKALYKEK